jgi:two-component system cell cycle response regulator
VRLTWLLQLASQTADICMAETSSRSVLMPKLVALGNGLGFADAELMGWCDEVVRDWTDWSRLLNVASQNLPPFADLLQQATTLPPASAAPGAGAMAAPAPTATTPCRVLVVAANAALRSQISEKVRLGGYACQEAASPARALALARQTPRNWC